MTANTAPENDKEESFISHLIELRDRLLKSVYAVLIVFVPAAIFSPELFNLLARPMLEALSTGGTMISTEVAGPLLVPLKFAFALSIAIAMPILLYQIWAFVAPGLYENEKRLVFPLLLSSTLLFYLGIAFAYFVVFPIIFSFFPSIAPAGIEVSPDINQYLGFVLKLFFAFGIAFEMPVATVLVIKAGLISAEDLAKKRRYVVLGAFVVGMFLTPPDIFSQTMLALPMWLLFEIGLFMSRFMKPVEEEEEEESTDEVPTIAPPPSAAALPVDPPAAGEARQSAATEASAEETTEDDVDADADEDLDSIAAELDRLEDITGWVEPPAGSSDAGETDQDEAEDADQDHVDDTGEDEVDQVDGDAPEAEDKKDG